jgi:predicted RND superfamily exporter protein
MYFIENDMIPDGRMGCTEFLRYVLELSQTNLVIAERLPEGAIVRLEKLIRDADRLSTFLDNNTEFGYLEIKDHITSFANSLESLTITVNLSDAAMMGLYVKYSVANDIIETGKISATDLLEFVLDAADTNDLLKDRINGDMRDTIIESKENMASADSLLRAEHYSRILLTVTLPPESEESAKFVEFLSQNVKEIFGSEAYVAGEIATTNDLTKAFDDDNRLISIITVVSIFLIIIVVFKSLSLPVILVAIIQGAIWISMSITTLTGGAMFFMSYIMSMCILMGATIDYGILLSTNYIRARETKDKRDALCQALDGALPTIFTSGLILMVCGAVVGFVASQTSISSVGFLLFRGTLVSVLMITMVLPALLYILDKFVMLLTIKNKTK